MNLDRERNQGSRVVMTEASERRGRSLERKPLRISSNDDSEISSSSKNTNSTPPLEAASAAAHTPSAPRSFAISDSSPSPSASPSRLSLWEKKAMDDLSEDFTSSLYQVSRQREFSNSLALQLDANVEARLRYLHHTADHDRGPKGLTADERHIEDSPMSTETPSLSSNGSESPLGSEEDLSSLHHHLPNFYADATPTGSTTTLTLLDDLSAASTPTAEDTPWQLSPPRAGSTTTTSSSQDSSSSEHGEAEGEDDNDSRMLSFPLKVCAYALALLPIPTSLLSTAAGSLGGASGRLPSSRAQSPPPLPVEFSHSPKTYRPRHRSSGSTLSPSSLPSSPRDSVHNLPALSSAASPSLSSSKSGRRPKRRVCFDRVVIISSPSDSDSEDLLRQQTYDENEDNKTCL